MLRNGHSQRLRSLLSGCIHETVVRWRDRQHASGASPATWVNLSLCVSPGSVRAMREQGHWYWVTDTLDSTHIKYLMGKEVGEVLYAGMFSQRLGRTRGHVHWWFPRQMIPSMHICPLVPRWSRSHTCVSIMRIISSINVCICAFAELRVRHLQAMLVARFQGFPL